VYPLTELKSLSRRRPSLRGDLSPKESRSPPLARALALASFGASAKSHG